MKKSFITLAIFIALVPHLGFPQMWKDVFVSIAAALIIVLVAIPRKETVPQEKTKREASFIESSPEAKVAMSTAVSHEETFI
jgi:hypothetical protein